MNDDQRRIYFTQLWPNACDAQDWDPRDTRRRHLVTAECMRLVGAPASDSVTTLGEAEVTALFTYLRHLGDPQNLRLLSAWMSCQKDYRTFNTARQGNYWRAKAGYKSRGRCDRDRFANKPTAGLFDESTMTAKETEDYLVTMRKRSWRKHGREDASRRDNPF